MPTPPHLPGDRFESDAALPIVLSAVARELGLIVELGERTQAGLSPLLAGGRAAPVDIQDLDSLVQHACGLAVFVAAIGEACAMGWSVSPAQAADRLGLEAQRRRLSSPSSPALPLQVASPASGALELL